MRRLPAALSLLFFFACVDAVHGARKRTVVDRPAEAVEVFRCGFDEEWDVNYDKWPDRWRRETGPEFPRYVEIKIVDDERARSGRALRARLDGARALIVSPRIRVMPKFSYFMELRIKLEQIKDSRVTVELAYLNQNDEVRQTVRAAPIASTDGWATVTLGPERPRHDDIDRAVIRIETDRGDHGDLNGMVSIADIWLGRNPSLDIYANNRFHVYNDPRDVVITCSLSGIAERDPEIKFQLLDATERAIGNEGVRMLDGTAIAGSLLDEESLRASDIVDGVGNHSVGFEGATQWRPQIKEPGFYHVHVKMLSSQTGREMDNRRITLAVIPPLSVSEQQSPGEFGWTLPRADQPLSFAELETLLPLVGVNWVKLPIWFPKEDPDRGQEIIQFAERIAASDIETVGVILHPDHLAHDSDIEVDPDDLTRQIANVLGQDPSRWLPMFDHIMNRLSLRIRWWQLGTDHDTSFVGYANLVQQIRDIRHQLYRFGQDVGLGIGWRWDTPLLENAISWEFNQLASNPPLDAEGLDAGLEASMSGSGRRWVLIEPNIDESAYANADQRHEARVREFIKQIVVAKRHGADGLFIPDPFSGPTGLMTADGKPGELLLPWRTAAKLLGGAEYLGELQLPAGSRNWLFLRPDSRVVMVLWNERPAEETLYLGDSIRVIDVWGKPQTPPKRDGRDVIAVGRTPKFVLGLNEAIARWRMSVRFEKDRLPSVFGQELDNALLLKNGFRQGVAGRISLFVPEPSEEAGGAPRASDHWRIATEGEDFSVGGGAPFRMPLEVALDDASIGRQPIRVDFTVSADRVEDSYRFSVWRSIDIDLGGVEVDLQTLLDDRGRLIVHQRMTNSSGEPISFKCSLYANGRRRKRAQVFELGPEVDLKTYTYTGGAELIGTPIKLRAEEIDGPRVLIQRFVAEE